MFPVGVAHRGRALGDVASGAAGHDQDRPDPAGDRRVDGVVADGPPVAEDRVELVNGPGESASGAGREHDSERGHRR